ncbi:MAG TPA: Gfo/Idh/MocA family oxidoreductase, partial [Arachnia sp.]|nr:Gfo/Idh/MocA family oxidoreductase [Arachnia sp.]
MSLTLPTPRTPDPMSAPPLRWGVLGSGWISSRFIETMHANTRQRVVAVGSRTRERAEAFAASIGAERAYGSYEEVVGDAGLGGVYVATPHTEH